MSEVVRAQSVNLAVCGCPVEDVDFPWVSTDGGRQNAGFVGSAGDCVTRALAVATGEPYLNVYNELGLGMKARGRARSARNGVERVVYDAFLKSRGWTWTATMQIGSGTTTHLHPDELPSGRLVVRVSKHMVAVVDGIPHDTHDPSRDGKRCVYGFYTPPEDLSVRCAH